MPTELPIDVIPGPGPLHFRWRYTTDTVVGPRTQVCEGSLQSSAEPAVTTLIGIAKQLQLERDKLQAFKDWVHAYLDARDVPVAPPGVHGAAGCRIGDRMDWLMDRLNELQRLADLHRPVVQATEPVTQESATLPSRDRGRRK